MRTIRTAVGLILISGLVCVAAILADSGSRVGRMMVCEQAHQDVEPGAGECATADRRQRRLMRALVRQAGDSTPAHELTIDYPSDESIFPPEMIAPTFLWHDAALDSDRWLVEVEFPELSPIRVLVPGGPPPEGEIDPRCISVTNSLYEPTPYQASANAWTPSAELWEMIKRGALPGPATVTIVGYDKDRPDHVLSRGRMTLRTSRDPVGAPVFYRDVPLMPSATKEGVIKPLDQAAQPLIAWRLRDLSLPASRVMLRDMPTCANCHSFSADGSTMGMDVDGPDGDKGAYAVAPVQNNVVIDDEQIMTWNAFKGKLPGHHTLGFMSRVSPDGRYVISTVNEAIYVNNFTDHRFIQVFYPTRGILAFVDPKTGEITPLPGADDPEYVHCNPVWTPDGKTIFFARARARDPYERGRPLAQYAGDPNETPIRYDLYRIPFNDGKGGTAEPVEGASNNGMSNAFGKVSPDGRWLVFVQSANGLLMRPDSRLWIVPAAGGKAREMRCNQSLMNSWHSFSPNSRWMVFSSKSNTPYTQMFLTHIDEEGNDSPALLIPNSTAANRAINLPEFVNVDYDEFLSISVPAVEHYHYFRRGNELARAGRIEESIAEFERAVEGEREEWRLNDWRIHDSLSKSLLRMGKNEEAIEHARESLQINPYNPEMHVNLGYLLAEIGRFEPALQALSNALRLRPRDASIWYNRATVQLRAGDGSRALEDYTEAIRLDPQYADAYNGRGSTLMTGGDLTAALADFDRSIELVPDDPTPWYFRALVHDRMGDRATALEDLERALEVTPRDSPRRGEIEALRERLAGAGD